MDQNTEFPQYYHVEDLYGNVFAVICREGKSLFTVIHRREDKKAFLISKVSNKEDLKKAAPGQILGCSEQDYKDVLIKEFRFSLSPYAMGMVVKAGEEEEEENDTGTGDEDDIPSCEKAGENSSDEDDKRSTPEKTEANNNKPKAKETKNAGTDNKNDGVKKKT